MINQLNTSKDFSSRQDEKGKFFFKLRHLNDKSLLASYEISYLVAKAKKPYTVGEDLVLPSAIRMKEIFHGKKYSKETRDIPLTKNTVKRRVVEISHVQSK